MPVPGEYFISSRFEMDILLLAYTEHVIFFHLHLLNTKFLNIIIRDIAMSSQ